MTSFVLEDVVIDIAAVLTELRERGYARLGRVVSDEGIAAMRARIDDIMLGKVCHDGLFFQHDSDTGRYEDLVRRPIRSLPKD
jgi:hypothetical protein